MQVSTRALAWIAVVTAGLVATQLVVEVARSRRTRSEWSRGVDRIALSTLADSASRLGIRVRTSEARRRVDSALAAPQAQSSPALLVLGGGSAAALATRADSEFRSLGFPVNPRVPVHLTLIEGPTTARVPPGFLQSFTLLPGQRDGRGCVGVRIVRPDEVTGENGREGRQRLALGGALGPCWYLASFGEPGPEVRQWLDSRYWDVAGAIPADSVWAVHTGELQNSPTLLFRLFAPVLNPFFAQSAVQAGCAGEKPQLCEVAFLAPMQGGVLPEGIAGGEGIDWIFQVPNAWMIGLPRSTPRSLLARMVDDLGPTRFAEFWTSRAPVPEAFRASAGMSLGEWYREQLRNELKAAGQPAPLGPPFWPSTLGLLALVLLATLWQARRRQVR